MADVPVLVSYADMHYFMIIPMAYSAAEAGIVFIFGEPRGELPYTVTRISI